MQSQRARMIDGGEWCFKCVACTLDVRVFHHSLSVYLLTVDPRLSGQSSGLGTQSSP
ncbi:hypothetical protein PAXRUDRAFT_827923 [Paxillus rubicundulus Ve08.2h10]|uniref:Uncharacterized protein n=1 Tax=Paxillus rubicundulus Ve08.2h10 TaxID=930991 RepID=A0A0D0DX08_9AGAM|nr:hypothetical protein PAXRUDRAFT_827923 [Paxillus rubicundulus Ve08.2h10]